ncbi:hypothetical protein DCAR_0205769 [Daucus carota subsp. sativus]|uniref:Uncharacterized protein n=1 Tax=Daucus carota subsp. sativus TaxID=79200 RepID=A0A166CUC0_DAUCS|nr:hypothetical protein DCAR_0205769 [Daucus carota subsp. sativus]
MRHMETYKGHTTTWQSDLNDEKHGQQSQVIKLRVKYNNPILSSQLNERKSDVLEAAKALCVDIASKKLTNFVIQSSQQSQEEEITKLSKPTTQKKKKDIDHSLEEDPE